MFTFIGGLVTSIQKTFGGLIDFITGVFSGDWNKAWQGIYDFFKGIWDGICAVFRFIVNAIIDGINGLWTGIYNFVSGVINAIGGIAGAIGSVIGQDWSFSMPENPPLIPRFEEPTESPARKFAKAVLLKLRHLRLSAITQALTAVTLRLFLRSTSCRVCSTIRAVRIQ